MTIRGIHAVVFDMDGTLVDSEGSTERAVAAVLAEHGLPGGRIVPKHFHGLSWDEAARLLVSRYPELSDAPLETLLEQRFHTLLVADPPPLIAGAWAAMEAASRTLPTAVVSSSSRRSVELVVTRAGLLSYLQFTICAEDCERPKPAPDCYLIAAARFGVPPARCLVFEDSPSGLQAAASAGAQLVAITGGVDGARHRAARDLARRCIADYTCLEPEFFTMISERRG
jgi:HAD superfamily hydrolase (TIGR01509 family)